MTRRAKRSQGETGTMALMTSLFLLLLLSAVAAVAADVVQVEPDGTQHEVVAAPDPSRSRKATFVNMMSEGECGLYWVGNNAAGGGGGPRLFYGPLSPRGGERTIEGFPGQVFALVRSGTYDKLIEFTIAEEGGGDGGSDSMPQWFALTDDDVAARGSAELTKADASFLRERIAATCRSAGASSCEECAELTGCGWSVVRRGCFLSHPIATADDSQECAELGGMPAASSQSVEAWLNEANGLVLYGYGPRRLRRAYRALERGAEAAAEAEARAETDAQAKATTLATKKVNVALSELSAKLDAVFDDVDATELLAESRHDALAAIHPEMPMVDRRTVAEARAYISRGEPVVITDAFDGADAVTSPVAHKWTLEYLRRRVFGEAGGKTGEGEPPRFNVAADAASRCCRYFEPQGKAKQAGYPYPFAPSTHLYRDTFDGFVQTVRKAARINSSKPTRVLHYLHEIVMNGEGEAVVAGAAAPPQLVADLDAVTETLGPIASDQPFFGGFASAKVWLGQRGIVMPIHYDATDNLYVMAWGRKRAIVAAPGQLDAFYRYPNDHPLVGSSQVNLTAPNLERFPRIKNAQLREVIVGPGDVLYLPAWWWHQFEQPFEDTAALNLWSKDRDQAPEPNMRDLRVREHALSDELERSVVQLFGNKAGIVLGTLASKQNGTATSASSLDEDDASVDDQQIARANEALHAAAEAWRRQVTQMPGGHPKSARPAAELVAEYLELSHSGAVREGRRPDWKPGGGWDLSRVAKLPRDLRERCEAAPESSPFMSYCG